MSSKGINKAIILGNLGKDPEVKYMPNGTAVANFSIATSETWKDKAGGESQEKTEWHNCVAFGRLAEIIEQYVKKGSKVYCEGKIQTRSWEKDGVKRYTTEINVNELQMLDSREQSNHQSRPEPKQSSGPDTKPSFDDFEDSIPY